MRGKVKRSRKRLLFDAPEVRLCLVEELPGRKKKRPTISTARDAWLAVKDRLGAMAEEMSIVMVLDIQCRIISISVVGEGTPTRVVTPRREAVTPVLLQNGYGLIVAHNHPSGDPTPSHADITSAKELYEVTSKLGLYFPYALTITKTSFGIIYPKLATVVVP